MTDDTNIAAAPPNDLARSTPGEYLRRLREEKGHSYAVVSSALHLTVHYIKALEGDEYGKLPGLTFVKGYLRSYARFLGADVDTVLARFDEHITGLLDAGQHTARVERSKRRQDQALRWAIGAGLVVVAGIAAGWWFMRDAQPADDTAQQGAAAAASQQVAADAVSTQPPAAAPTPPVAAFTAPANPAATEQESFTTTLVPEENEFGSTLVPEESEVTTTLVAEENEFGSTSTPEHSNTVPLSDMNAAPSGTSGAPDTSAPATAAGAEVLP